MTARNPALLVALLVAGAAVLGAAGLATAASNVHDVEITPGEVEEETTVDQHVAFSVDDVSADGSTDRVWIQFPDGAELSPNDVTVTDRSDGSGVSVTQSVEVVDGPDDDGVVETLTFAISPAAGDTVDVRVNASTTVTWPDRDNVEEPIQVAIEDSGGADVPMTELRWMKIEDTDTSTGNGPGGDGSQTITYTPTTVHEGSNGGDGSPGTTTTTVHEDGGSSALPGFGFGIAIAVGAMLVAGTLVRRRGG